MQLQILSQLSNLPIPKAIFDLDCFEINDLLISLRQCNEIRRKNKVQQYTLEGQIFNVTVRWTAKGNMIIDKVVRR